MDWYLNQKPLNKPSIGGEQNDFTFDVVDGVPTFFCLPYGSPYNAALAASSHARETSRAVRLVMDGMAQEIGPRDVLFSHKSPVRAG